MSTRLFNVAATKFGIDVRSFAFASRLSFGPLGIITAAISTIIGLAYGLDGMASDIKDINNKTPDPMDKQKSSLSNQIFSQLINIVTNTNQGYIQREMLNTQRELLRLTKQQNDWNSPNNSPASRIPERRIGGSI